jgi:hypothetical protein
MPMYCMEVRFGILSPLSSLSPSSQPDLICELAGKTLIRAFLAISADCWVESQGRTLASQKR